MNTEVKDAAEAAIRAKLDAITQAVRARDVEAFLAHCGPEIVTFDMLPPLLQSGPAALRRSWATAMEPFEGEIEYEVLDLEIEVGDDVAFTRSVNRFGGRQRDGTRLVNWMRSTLGLRKLDGNWKVVHQHVSVPFDMKTGKALLDLEP